MSAVLRPFLVVGGDGKVWAGRVDRDEPPHVSPRGARSPGHARARIWSNATSSTGWLVMLSGLRRQPGFRWCTESDYARARRQLRHGRAPSPGAEWRAVIDAMRVDERIADKEPERSESFIQSIGDEGMR